LEPPRNVDVAIAVQKDFCGTRVARQLGFAVGVCESEPTTFAAKQTEDEDQLLYK
jgi:hypothetical protein